MHNVSPFSDAVNLSWPTEQEAVSQGNLHPSRFHSDHDRAKPAHLHSLKPIQCAYHEKTVQAGPKLHQQHIAEIHFGMTQEVLKPSTFAAGSSHNHVTFCWSSIKMGFIFLSLPFQYRMDNQELLQHVAVLAGQQALLEWTCRTIACEKEKAEKK
ncbi:hypothetical protein DPMN_094475 [Dreissena polymorpha]|uniref:Uncharacterized protein n=1 Tax=Dreissena polymorpha TaxID=45954 RepID=A0A9D4R1V3_DREPO|nr:hypothetical protein DPMN_094475 [Dreissena polymorpha]